MDDKAYHLHRHTSWEIEQLMGNKALDEEQATCFDSSHKAHFWRFHLGY